MKNIRRTYLLVVMSLLLALPQQARSAASPEMSRSEGVQKIDPEFFFGGGGKHGFYFFDDYLELAFDMTRRRDVTNLSGILLQINSNHGNSKTLLIDWDRQSGSTRILVLDGERIHKYELPNFDWSPSSTTIPVRMTLHFRTDVTEIRMAESDISIPGLGLSVDTGYRFSFLPVLSQRPDPNIPPILDISDLRITTSQRPEQRNVWLWLAGIILVDLGIYAAMQIRRRRKPRDAEQPASAGGAPQLQPASYSVEHLPESRAIYLFGRFSLYDRKGENITRQCSPMLRELLCLIVIHSGGEGISSAQLKEILWPGREQKSARNNQAVYIGKLRALLNRLGECSLTNDTGYWKLNCGDLFVDYLEYERLIASPGPEETQIGELLRIVQHGSLLPDADYAWLDTYKARVVDVVIEQLGTRVESISVEQNPEFAIAMADTLFRFDHLNERALWLKCRTYHQTGRHASAKNAYDLFTQQYREIYDCNFPYSFTDVLNSNFRPE